MFVWNFPILQNVAIHLIHYCILEHAVYTVLNHLLNVYKVAFFNHSILYLYPVSSSQKLFYLHIDIIVSFWGLLCCVQVPWEPLNFILLLLFRSEMQKMPLKHLRSTSPRWERCTARIGRVSRESRPGTLCPGTLWRWQVRGKILGMHSDRMHSNTLLLLACNL